MSRPPKPTAAFWPTTLLVYAAKKRVVGKRVRWEVKMKINGTWIWTNTTFRQKGHADGEIARLKDGFAKRWPFDPRVRGFVDPAVAIADPVGPADSENGAADAALESTIRCSVFDVLKGYWNARVQGWAPGTRNQEAHHLSRTLLFWLPDEHRPTGAETRHRRGPNERTPRDDALRYLREHVFIPKPTADDAIPEDLHWARDLFCKHSLPVTAITQTSVKRFIASLDNAIDHREQPVVRSACSRGEFLKKLSAALGWAVNSDEVPSLTSHPYAGLRLWSRKERHTLMKTLRPVDVKLLLAPAQIRHLAQAAGQLPRRARHVMRWEAAQAGVDIRVRHTLWGSCQRCGARVRTFDSDWRFACRDHGARSQWPGDFRMEGAVLIAGFGGAREQEVVAVRPMDLSFPEDNEHGRLEITLRGAQTTAPARQLLEPKKRRVPLKHRDQGDTRPIPLPDFCIPVLRRMVDFTMATGGPTTTLLATESGNPMAPGALAGVWNWAVGVGLGGMEPPTGGYCGRGPELPETIAELATNFHALRHSAITFWLRANVAMETIKKWSGHQHASIILDIYAGALRGDEQEGLVKLDLWYAGKLGLTEASAPSCPNCGDLLPAQARFCPSCGCAVEESVEATASAGDEHAPPSTARHLRLVASSAQASTEPTLDRALSGFVPQESLTRGATAGSCAVGLSGAGSGAILGFDEPSDPLLAMD